MKANTFRTEITCPSAHPIGLKDRILTTGSCFADQFGRWLQNNKFDILVNPFGTNYNPISIHKCLLESLSAGLDDRLFAEHQGIWHHFDYHSQWSSARKEDLKASIQKIQQQVNQYLKKTDVLIITYGTAWVYHHKTQNIIVSNCHKVPAIEFEKRLLTVEEITESFRHLYAMIKSLRPDIRIIITVSPVRHIKDTLVLNSVSKATLRLACHTLSDQYEDVEYFPSYEIMMDDLRDYRFYDRDKIHPNEEAIDYISQKFSDQYFEPQVKRFIEKWHSVRQSMEHRPYHPNSEAHQHFLKDLLHKLEELKEFVPVEEEIKTIQSQIHTNV
jgi:lysophospholipase L1-like esterase